MKTQIIKTRLLSLVSISGLLVGLVVGVPTSAQAADPQCLTANYVTQCAGATSDSALYTMVAPANFNGTLLLWSHGLRPNIDIPAGIPSYGGYKVNSAAEFAPGLSDGDLTILNTLVAKGYGVAGSGFARQGVNVTQGVAANVELIAAFKKKFPTTTKVVAWGASLGTQITQTLTEQHPELVDAAVLGCPATAPGPVMIKYFGDFMWAFKTFFDPTIKGFGYSAGKLGEGEAALDMQKFFVALSKISAGTLSGAWPDTSSAAGKALEAGGVPVRSAMTLVALLAGVPLRSEHIDGNSSPVGLETAFELAYTPAIAATENGGTVGLASILLMQDGESQGGGIVFDNKATDYAALIAEDRDVYSAALSGNGAIDSMLGVLAASPRVTGSATAMAKVSQLLPITGKINVPTVLMTAESDQFTVAGTAQFLIDSYKVQYAAAKTAAMAASKKSRTYTTPVNKLLPLWEKTAENYTVFSGATPDLTKPAGRGTGHCKFTNNQWLTAADLAIGAAKKGSFGLGGTVATTARKVGLTYDTKFRVPVMRGLQG